MFYAYVRNTTVFKIREFQNFLINGIKRQQKLNRFGKLRSRQRANRSTFPKMWQPSSWVTPIPGYGYPKFQKFRNFCKKREISLGTRNPFPFEKWDRNLSPDIPRADTFQFYISNMTAHIHKRFYEAPQVKTSHIVRSGHLGIVMIQSSKLL